jgi:flagellar hook-associated protein 2
MPISSPGVGSNLDVNSIVTQLVALERRPLEKVQTAAVALQTQISTYGKVQGLVSALGSAAEALARPTLWSGTKATVSLPEALSATSSSSATPGSYSIEVGTLARAQSLASAPVASSAAVVGAGKLTIDLGSWSTGNTAFTVKDGSSALELEFTDANTTLAQVRDAINAANKGVVAAIVTDAAGARLTLRSKDTGLPNALRISATDGVGTPITTGLGTLAYDPANAVNALTETQTAANASVTINGLPITSPSNKLSGVLDGVTLDLTQTTTAPVTVTVSDDTAAMKDTVKKFVDAYNALNAFLAEQTKYDDEAKIGGALQGDSAAVGLRNQMRGLLRESGGASDVFERLSDVGFNVQRDGSIVLDNAKFDAGLTQVAEMAKLFANKTSATPGDDGLAVRFKKLADRVTGEDGLIDSRNDGLKARLKRNETEQERIEDRALRVQERLLRQYQALDLTISRLNSLQAYMTQQIIALQSQNNSNR